MRSRRLCVLVLLGVMLLMGNVPAPYDACQGKSAGILAAMVTVPPAWGPMASASCPIRLPTTPAPSHSNEQLACQSR
jgi:hypothetical protein